MVRPKPFWTDQIEGQGINPFKGRGKGRDAIIPTIVVKAISGRDYKFPMSHERYIFHSRLMDFQDFDWGEIPFDDLPQSVKERLIASGESERQKKMDKLMRELQKEMDESSNPDELHLSDSQLAEFLSLKIDYKDDDEKDLFESQGSEIPSLNTTVMDEL